MVVVKGGGTTYEITSGKVMPWTEVPQWFKDQAESQVEAPQCAAVKLDAQRCMEVRGFWDAACVALTDAFHKCSSDVLVAQDAALRPKTHTTMSSSVSLRPADDNVASPGVMKGTVAHARLLRDQERRVKPAQ